MRSSIWFSVVESRASSSRDASSGSRVFRLRSLMRWASAAMAAMGSSALRLMKYPANDEPRMPTTISRIRCDWKFESTTIVLVSERPVCTV
jgi:hypothetical protein